MRKPKSTLDSSSPTLNRGRNFRPQKDNLLMTGASKSLHSKDRSVTVQTKASVSSIRKELIQSVWISSLKKA